MLQTLHEYSKFPEQTYVPHNFKNVHEAPAEIQAVISMIKDAIASGNTAKASRLLSENKLLISEYFIDADIINALEEEIYNLEIYAKSSVQALYYCTNKPVAGNGDVWIG